MGFANTSVNNAEKAFSGIWKGESKIVVSVDIGRTQSGVAFTYLQKGAKQSMHRVLLWSDKEVYGAHGKIPSLLFYDADGKAVSFGAEAKSPGVEEDAEERGWQLAKYFKLHLRPLDFRVMRGWNIDPLPPNVALSQIYADFLGYLLKYTQQFFEERILDGPDAWCTYKSTMDIVITYPNGWGIREQTFLQTAAVAAGFTTRAQARHRVHFVTEAEASVHFFMQNKAMNNLFESGVKVAVCDAGGLTADTTVYTIKDTEPRLELEEINTVACVQAGGDIVDSRAKEYLEQILSGAGLSNEDIEEYVQQGVEDFEQGAKRKFWDTTVDQRIRIAFARFNQADINVKRGYIWLTGATLKSFFDPCVDKIVSSIRSQIALAAAPVPYILLTGGFGESPYLRERLKAEFSASGSEIIYTNEATSRAVADGALIWYKSNCAVSHPLQYAFGVESSIEWLSNSQEQIGYPVTVRPSGKFVKGIWSQLVPKGVIIDPNAVIRQPYCHEYTSCDAEMADVNQDFYAYASQEQPLWIRNKSGTLSDGFRKLHAITISLDGLRGALQPAVAFNGDIYWALRFCMCFRFRRFEVEVSLEWVENGAIQSGLSQIVPLGTE